MRSRRNVKNTKRRSRHRKMTRRVKTKRGGMMRQGMSLARSKMGTTLYHEILPLFTQFNTIFGKNPTPDQKAVVLKGERYFRSGADFPVDTPLKVSINKLIDEWSSTEQTAQKTLDIYNKILQTLENAEKRQKQKQKENITQTPGRARDTFSSPLSESLASIDQLSLRNVNSLRTPGKSSNTDTPQKVSGDEKGPQSVLTPSTGRSFAPTLHNPLGDKTVQHLSFDDELGLDTTPPASPASPASTAKFKSPPRLLSKTSRVPLSPSKPPRFLLG